MFNMPPDTYSKKFMWHRKSRQRRPVFIELPKKNTGTRIYPIPIVGEQGK